MTRRNTDTPTIGRSGVHQVCDNGNAHNLPRAGRRAIAAVGANPSDVIAWWKVPKEVQSQAWKAVVCPFLIFGLVMALCIGVPCGIAAIVMSVTESKTEENDYGGGGAFKSPAVYIGISGGAIVGAWCLVVALLACCCYSCTRSQNESQIVILTSDKLIRQGQVATFNGYRSGHDVQAYALKDILSVTSDRKGSGLCACWAYAQTVIMLPGFHSVGSGRRHHLEQNRMYLPCREEDVDAITSKIAAAKAQVDNMRPIYAVPIATGAPVAAPAQVVAATELDAQPYGLVGGGNGGAAPTMAGELETLTALWRQGALSDEQFNTAKLKLLHGSSH